MVQRFEAGAVPEISVWTSDADLASRTSEPSQLSDQQEKAEAALATLLGRSPQQILTQKSDSIRSLASLPVPPVGPDNLLSNLRIRRPDIAASEQMLRASNVNIGKARTTYFPTLSFQSARRNST